MDTNLSGPTKFNLTQSVEIKEDVAKKKPISEEDQKISKLEQESLAAISLKPNRTHDLNALPIHETEDNVAIIAKDVIQEKLSSKNQNENTIKQIWDDGKGNRATEQATRIETVHNLKLAAQKELSYLKTILPKENDPNKILEIKDRIKFLNLRIKECELSKSSWASSNFYRDLLKTYKRTDSSEFKDDIKAYEKFINDKYYTFAPTVNTVYHSCKNDTKNVSLGAVRIGIISDMSNGYVNLESLKDLRSEVDKNDFMMANAKRNQMAREIIQVWKGQKGNPRIEPSIGYALKQLGYKDDEIVEIRNHLDERENYYTNYKLDNEAISKIDETIQKRESHLASQFLELLVENLNHLKEADLKDGQVKMLHVSLLNPQSKSVDPTGWNHDEKNEMYDMKAIFDRFDQSELICDGKGPFIDRDGNIHLPPGIPHIPYGEGKELTLRSLFVNQCVQGTFSLFKPKNPPTENVGDQKKINEECRKKMKNMGLENKETDAIFGAKNTGFKSAVDMIEIANDFGFKVSFGCLSAKDRTGFAGALMSDRVMTDFPKTSRIKFMREQIKKTAIAAKIIHQNTGAHYMKLTDFKIEGVTKNIVNFKSIGVRLKVYLLSLSEIMKEKFKTL